MPCKKRDFQKAATKKGFIPIKKGKDHIFYYFSDKDGKRDTRVHTKISHGGSGDISEELLAKMYKQLHFHSKNELLLFVDCSMSEDEYRDLIAKKFMA